MAPVLAREEPAPGWTKVLARRELHESFDFWRDSLEEAVKEEPPSLKVLTSAVLANRQELTGQVTEALVR